MNKVSEVFCNYINPGLLIAGGALLGASIGLFVGGVLGAMVGGALGSVAGYILSKKLKECTDENIKITHQNRAIEKTSENIKSIIAKVKEMVPEGAGSAEDVKGTRTELVKGILAHTMGEKGRLEEAGCLQRFEVMMNDCKDLSVLGRAKELAEMLNKPFVRNYYSDI